MRDCAMLGDWGTDATVSALVLLLWNTCTGPSGGSSPDTGGAAVELLSLLGPELDSKPPAATTPAAAPALTAVGWKRAWFTGW